MKNPVGWLREPVPGVSWQQLLAFLQLPIAWLMLVTGSYVVAVIANWISPEDRWSAAEVFVGIAGGGAALVALAAVAKELAPGTPKLELFVDDNDGGSINQLYVRNIGGVPAYELELQIAPSGSFSANLRSDWVFDYSSSGVAEKFLRAAPLHAHAGGPIGVIHCWGETKVEVILQCANGRGDAMILGRTVQK